MLRFLLRTHSIAMPWQAQRSLCDAMTLRGGCASDKRWTQRKQRLAGAHRVRKAWL